MECFDISNVSSNHIVASMVRFTDGRPDNQNYRRYRIRTVEGQDDFASMAEVIRRRYSRILLENSAANPDAEVSQEDPVEAQRRTLARRLAVSQDRVRRLEKAREAQAEIERQREEQRQKQRRKEKPRDPDKEARASTVDPEARLMKMADGSVRFFSENTTDFPGLMAASFMMSVPVVVLFLVLQKYFVRALTEGAVKH